MFKRFFAVVMLTVFGAQTVTCTVPDDENWDQLVRSINAFPPDVLSDVEKHQSVQEIQEWFNEKWVDEDSTNQQRLDDTFLKVKCTGGENDLTFGWTVDDLLSCLYMSKNNVLRQRGGIAPSGVSKRQTFEVCFQALIDKSYDLYAATGVDDPECKPELDRLYQDAPIKQWSNEEWDEEDLSRIAVESATVPDWFWAAFGITVAVVSGTVVIVAYPPSAAVVVPALCALREGGSRGCPAHPLYPGQPRPGDGK